MKIIGHHTCDSRGKIVDLADIQANAPFLSEHIKGESEKMLGTGYYFFDNNLDVAHAHGKNRYKRHYHIFEAELHLTEDIFLDLVGNRIDMIWLVEMMENLSSLLGDVSNLRLGNFIELLKKLNQMDGHTNIFPYKVVRVLDSYTEQHKEENKIYFFPNRPKFLNIKPVFTVCVFEKDSSIIKSITHKFSK